MVRYCIGQIAVGGGDNPHVHADGPGSSQPLKFMVLKCTQQFWLQFERYFSDFIE